jgi:hypothetical protein
MTPRRRADHRAAAARLFSARATGGVAASFAGGATLGAGGEIGGIGSATHIWTWTARGRIPF